MNRLLIFWIGPSLVLQVVLLAVMLKGNKYKAFPCFFVYTIFSIFADISRMASYHSGWVYFRVYWASEIAYSFLGIAVMYEVYRAVLPGFRPFWWFRLILPVVVLFTTAITAFHMAGVPSGLHDPIMNGIVTAELWVRVLQVTIFVLLAMLVAFFGLRWRQHSFGIAAGFGLYSTVALLGTEKYSEFGTRFTWAWSVLTVVAYSMAVLIWLWFFSGATPLEAPASQGPPFPIEDLGRYKDFLRGPKDR